MRTLGVIELERTSERFQHKLRGAADLPALQAPVVVGADAGQRRDLLTSQTRHPPHAVARQTDLLGREPGPARSQKLGDVVGGRHDFEGRPFVLTVGGPLEAPDELGFAGTVLCMSTDLNPGRVAVITGASSGIGEAAINEILIRPTAQVL